LSGKRPARRVGGGAAALTVALVLAACGDDDSAETTPATADVDRYCALTAELDRAGREQFEALERDPSATEEQFEAAERELVEDNEEQLAELVAVAPEEIESHVEVLIGALRERAGLDAEDTDPAAVRDAERALARFEQENC
jgi:hypothetical protein